MKPLLLTVLLASLLVGCADKPVRDATIEDRMIASGDAGAQTASTTVPAVTPPTSRTAPGAVTQAATPAQVDTGALPSEVARTPATGTAVQTRGIDATAPEVKVIPPDATDTPGVSTVRLDPRDPAGPLAQRRIHFDFDSAAIRDEYRALLEAHAAYLKQEPSAAVVLHGHTDERGSREYNLALGQRRAESVLRALNLLGVTESRMEAVSFGEEKPLVEGQNEMAWSQNRRTEIHYVGE